MPFPARVFPIVVALLTSCASSDSKPYVARVATLSVAPHIAMAAVQEQAAAQGWTVIAVSESRMEAVAPSADLAGIPTREHWLVDVDAGVLRLTRHFEANFDGTGWMSADDVCATYAYHAEDNQLAAFMRRLRDASDASPQPLRIARNQSGTSARSPQ